MQSIYIILSIIQIVYFLFKKRKVDLYMVAFFSSVLYFFPGIVGYTIYPGGIEVELDQRVYIVYILVQLSVWVAAIVKDHFSIKKVQHLGKVKVEGTQFTSLVLSVIGLLLTLYYIFSLNSYLLENKSILMPLLGPLFILLNYSASLAFVIAFVERKKVVMVISAITLFFTFLIGFRSPIALTAMALFTTYFSVKEKSPFFLQHYKKITGILVFGYIIFMGKIFYGAFQTVGLSEAFIRLFDPLFIKSSFYNLESFVTQTILNEVIKQKFHTGFSHLQGLIYDILVTPGLFGVDIPSFNELFQSALFPNVKYQMAYNIWAEAISVGGFPFLILINIIYILGIMILDKMCQSNNILLKSTSAFSGVYWAFYIHRSSISVELSYQRYVIYTVLIGMTISFILNLFFVVAKKRN